MQRRCRRVVPVGKRQEEVLERLVRTRIPGDPDFVSERPLPGERGSLYLALDAAAYRKLQCAGIPCACVAGEGTAGEAFEGADFVLLAPEEIEAAVYERIYDRLYHLPWLIRETERLVIREETLEDLDALYLLYDSTAAQYLPVPDPDREVERALLAAYIEKVYGLMGYGYWAVVEKESGELIGRAGYGVPGGSGELPELGYLIRQDRRCRGYALEAVRAVLSYGKEELGFTAVQAKVPAGNAASAALLRKAGFRESCLQDSQQSSPDSPGAEKERTFTFRMR